MADYRTQFSEEIKDLTDVEENWIRNELTPEHKREKPKDFLDQWIKNYPMLPHNECENWPEFGWGIEDRVLWVFSDDVAANIEHVSVFVQRFINKFRPNYYFKMTWANTCSKPRVGSFSGGWAVVSKDRWLYGDTVSDAERALAKLESGK